jgi:hypothetical protein
MPAPRPLSEIKKKPPVRKGDYLSEPIQKLAYKLGLVDNPSAADVRKEAYAAGSRSVKKEEPKKEAVAQQGKAKNKPKTISPDASIAQADKAKPRSVAPSAPEAKKVVRDPRDVAPRPAAGNVRDRAAMDAMAARNKKPEAAAPKKEEAKPNLIRPKSGEVPNGIRLKKGPEGRRPPWTGKQAKAAETARAARTAFNTEDARELPKADGRPAFKNDVYKLKVVEKKPKADGRPVFKLGEKKDTPVPKPKPKPQKEVVKVGAVKKAKSFKEGFAEARAKGREVFEWNGKKYNTRWEGEKKSVNLRRMKEKRASERQKILGR